MHLVLWQRSSGMYRLRTDVHLFQNFWDFASFQLDIKLKTCNHVPITTIIHHVLFLLVKLFQKNVVRVKFDIYFFITITGLLVMKYTIHLVVSVSVHYLGLVWSNGD